MADHEAAPTRVSRFSIWFPHQKRAYPQQWLDGEENDQAVQNLLAAAKTHQEAHNQRPTCCCRRDRPDGIEMCIVHKNSRHFLRRMPDTGEQHQGLCCHHQEDPQLTGASGYAGPALSRNEKDGTFTIYLDTPLRTQDPAPREQQDLPRNKSGSREKASILGLLHLLWEESRNNHGFPNKPRDWGRVRYFLQQVAHKGSIGRRQLENWLYCAPRTAMSREQLSEDTDYRRVITPLIKEGKDKHDHRLLIGELSAIQEPSGNRPSHTLAIKNLAAHTIILPEDQHARIMRRFGEVAKVLQDPAQPDRDRVIVIANLQWRVAKTKAWGYFMVVDAALMRVTPDYIPVDSGYESVVARKLTAQQRLFKKPMRYDATEMTLPDFVLLDTTNPVYMEVYGRMNDEKYAQHTAQKKALYQSRGDETWSWEPTGADSEPPPFPSRDPAV